jgi:hypothetical protein
MGLAPRPLNLFRRVVLTVYDSARRLYGFDETAMEISVPGWKRSIRRCSSVRKRSSPNAFTGSAWREDEQRAQLDAKSEEQKSSDFVDRALSAQARPTLHSALRSDPPHTPPRITTHFHTTR